MSATRIAAIWLLLAVLMIANGIFREVTLVPVLGRLDADIASVVIGIAIILGATRPFIRSAAATLRSSDLVRTSLVWFGLTLAFEFLFGHYVDHVSWADLMANLAIWRGQLFPLVLVALAVAPFVWGRWIPTGHLHVRDR